MTNWLGIRDQCQYGDLILKLNPDASEPILTDKINCVPFIHFTIFTINPKIATCKTLMFKNLTYAILAFEIHLHDFVLYCIHSTI